MGTFSSQGLRSCLVVMLVIVTGSIRAEDAPSVREIRYDGIRPSDPGGRSGLQNPERGFRLEAYIGQPPGSPMSTWVRAWFTHFSKKETDFFSSCSGDVAQFTSNGASG